METSTRVGHPKVLVARRYLERGFLDAAMRLFVANTALVEKSDWSLLVDRLMERHRIADAIRMSEIGDVSLPRAQLLALGDSHLRRKDVDGVIRFYELGHADRERWTRVLDMLTSRPEQQLRAIELAERHLTGDESAVELRLTGIE